jgi:hypothetical protein
MDKFKHESKGLKGFIFNLITNTKFLANLLGFCSYHCEFFQYQKHYRRNTAYVDDKMNYGYSRPCCIKEEDTMYEEMWKDYYSGCL